MLVPISKLRPVYVGIPYHEPVVEKWRMQIRRGKLHSNHRIPPLTVVKDFAHGVEGYAVVSGHHRLEAYRLEGVEQIEVEVK